MTPPTTDTNSHHVEVARHDIAKLLIAFLRWMRNSGFITFNVHPQTSHGIYHWTVTVVFKKQPKPITKEETNETS